MRIIVPCLFIILLTSHAYACRCVPPSDATEQEAIINTDVVITATVLTKQPAWNGGGPAVRLKIIETHKANENLPEEMLANYNPSEAACGREFEIGETYFIGLYDVRDLKNSAIRGHGYRIVNTCNTYYLEHHYKNKKSIETEKEESI